MGQVINIRGLVTDVISNEIVLCLGALKRLGIVDADYPKIRQNGEEQGVGSNFGEHQSARAMKTSVPVTVPGRTLNCLTRSTNPHNKLRVWDILTK